MARLGPPFGPPNPTENVCVGVTCVLSQEMRRANFSGAQDGVLGGGESLC